MRRTPWSRTSPAYYFERVVPELLRRRRARGGPRCAVRFGSASFCIDLARNRVERGAPDGADVTLSCDYELFARILRFEADAADALAAGQLSIDGDPAHLFTLAECLAPPAPNKEPQ